MFHMFHLWGNNRRAPTIPGFFKVFASIATKSSFAYSLSQFTITPPRASAETVTRISIAKSSAIRISVRAVAASAVTAANH